MQSRVEYCLSRIERFESLIYISGTYFKFYLNDIVSKRMEKITQISILSKK